MSIIDSIVAGVVDPASNVALNYLSQILGSKLIFGTGEVSSLVTLSSTLNPLYIGLLFLILAYIGVGGVIQSAIHGNFLGRWGQVQVPSMFIACIVLLSPVPSMGGSTLGQVVFVKSVVFGSNTADYILKSVFTNKADASDTKYNVYTKHLEQVNYQMMAALPTYICGEQLLTMGYQSNIDYFLLLHDVCGLPSDIIGSKNFKYLNEYALGNKSKVNALNANNSKYRALGIDMPETPKYDTTKVEENAKKMSDASEQLACHFTTFKNVFQRPVNYDGIVISKTSPPIGSYIVKNQVVLNSTMLKINTEALGAAWTEALKASYDCLKSKSSLASFSAEPTVTKPTGNEPWKEGWVQAARIIQQELDSYEATQNKAELPLQLDSIRTPEYTKLGSSSIDRRNVILLGEQLNGINSFIQNSRNAPAKAPQYLGSLLSAGQFDAGSPLTWGRAAAMTALIPVTAAVVKEREVERLKAIASKSQNAFDAKNAKLARFLDTLVGKATTSTANVAHKVMGAMTSKAAVLMRSLNVIVEKAVGVDEGIGSIPGGKAVKAVASFFKGVAKAIPSGFAMSTILIMLTAMNAIIILPQVILFIVGLIWTIRTAIWYMVLPLATVIIALPNTRAGHDIWKTALSVVITPMLALVFFLISLVITDIMYSAVLSWVLDPIMSEDGWSLILEIATQLFTGELFFRVIIGLSICIALTIYMAMMILRGPDLVFSSLGLRGGSEELGRDIHQIREKLDPSARMGVNL